MGRSGVYMVIDSMIERIEDENTVDVFNFLNHIRTQRMALVQEEVCENSFFAQGWIQHDPVGRGGSLPALMAICRVPYLASPRLARVIALILRHFRVSTYSFIIASWNISTSETLTYQSENSTNVLNVYARLVLVLRKIDWEKNLRFVD